MPKWIFQKISGEQQSPAGGEVTYTAMDTLKKIENNDMKIRRLYYLAPL